MHETRSDPEKDPNATPISAAIRTPSPIYFWINHRYDTFARYYSALFIILSILRSQERSLTSDIAYVPLCISAQDRFASRHHRCTRSYFIWSGTFRPSPPRRIDIFANKYIQPIFTSAGKKKFPRSRRKLDFLRTNLDGFVRTSIKRYEIFSFLHSLLEKLLIFVE